MCAGGDGDGETATPKKKAPAKNSAAEGSAKKGSAKKRKLEEATEVGTMRRSLLPSRTRMVMMYQIPSSF